jgi:hypothetical protein
VRRKASGSKLGRPPARSIGGARGQASSEFILIIGLIVLAVILALFVFRDSVVSFTDRAAAWLDSFGEHKTSPPPKAEAPPEPPPKPDPLDSLAGTWCWNWINPDGTESPSPTKIDVSRSPSGDMTWNYGASHDPLEPTGDRTFRMKDHPDINFQSHPDGSITPTDRNNVVLRRCS